MDTGSWDSESFLHYDCCAPSRLTTLEAQQLRNFFIETRADGAAEFEKWHAENGQRVQEHERRQAEEGRHGIKTHD